MLLEEYSLEEAATGAGADIDGAVFRQASRLGLTDEADRGQPATGEPTVPAPVSLRPPVNAPGRRVSPLRRDAAGEHRPPHAFALEDDGWWLRSAIVWAKPNPMPESVRDRPTNAYDDGIPASEAAQLLLRCLRRWNGLSRAVT